MHIINIAFFVLLRLICYPAPLLLVGGIAAMIAVSIRGDCPTMNESSIRCASETSKGLADFGMSVLLASAFTGIPVIGAIGGLIFLFKDIGRLRRRFSRAPS